MRDAAGAGELLIDFPREAETIADLCAWIELKNGMPGGTLTAPGTRYAINQRFADIHTPIAGASEIAFMSPLSGG